MNIGNFFLNDAVTVYIDDGKIFNTDNDGFVRYDDALYEDLIDRIREQLPKDYLDVEKPFERDNGTVIAENDDYEVVVTPCETFHEALTSLSTSYHAVSFVLRESGRSVKQVQNALAEKHLPVKAKQLFDKLFNYFELRVRNDAWSSHEYHKAA